MNTEYIIIQAGGKGTRLEHLTKNKPKALVPVENLPMLFHLFEKFPDKKFIIIGDYHKEVLREYLSAFAKVSYQMVEAEGSGTCSGVSNALSLLPEGKPFLLIWSDLILPDSFSLPNTAGDYIGISQSFPCRWKYEEKVFAESPSTTHGVAGLFLFQDKKCLEGLPDSGELVRWISGKNFFFQELGLSGTREFGILEEYQALEVEKCRPFNKITVKDGIFIKEAKSKQGEDLAKRERNWYEYAMAHGVKAIPPIHQLSPLHMEEIKGKNIYDCSHLSFQEKKNLLTEIIQSLEEIHQVETTTSDSFSLKEAYFKKTISRLNAVRDLIPFAEKKNISINGKVCRNIFFQKRAFEKLLDSLNCPTFTFIHGDCTFSNIMIGKSGKPVFFDPRGYFGNTELFGDPNYDWAKLYYSLVGQYDHFNLKEFDLDIEETGVKIKIPPKGFHENLSETERAELETLFFTLTKANPEDIQLIHAVIWLSLTTYAWQDYDSICGAFYRGLYLLEDCYDVL